VLLLTQINVSIVFDLFIALFDSYLILFY